MFQSTAASIRHPRGRLATAVLIIGMLLGAIPFSFSPSPTSANHASIKWPFAKGSNWVISQGYNTAPGLTTGASHWNCNPTTLKDEPTGTQSCSRYYQYKFALDLRKETGDTAGQPVLSPVNGTIRWIDLAFGGMSIDLGDGYAYAFFHVSLTPGLKAGQSVVQGDLLGTVAPPGEGGNGGFPHIHITLWSTTDGGNWSRTATPFTDTHKSDGYDLPHLGESSRNQHRNKVIVSTNVPRNVGGGDVPAVPILLTPATGTNFPTVNTAPTLTWSAVSGATHYMVQVNDGEITSPWVSGTSYTLPPLTAKQYAWQVKARNDSGESGWSAKWVFWINSNGSTPTPTPTTTPPTGTPGPLLLTLNRSSAFFNAGVVATGSGFGAGEIVKLYLDSQSNPSFAQTTANAIGSFSFTFQMPETPGGAHTIVARGAKSTKRATAPLRMTSTLARTPVQGPPGTAITVTVYGYAASEQVRLNFDTESGALLGTATTNAKGTGTVNVTMPEATGGWHDYVGSGLTSGFRGYGALLVNHQATLSPGNGPSGSLVTISANGFPANDNVTVAWNKSTGIAGTSVCTGKTSAKGSYSCSFTTPQTIAGAFPVAVTGASGVTASAVFSVSGAAGVQIAPSSAMVSALINISGGGFNANEQVQLFWGTTAKVWATTRANASGTFFYPATVPNIPLGAISFIAKGVTSGKTSTTSFTVTQSGGDTGTKMTAPGTFAVTATREGLVGFTTSNGHVIVEDDHFVSLPACTQSSCPWLTPGGSTYVAACGDNCYVRVTNPATGVCSVAPVWDRGPWFINDNWWDPADKRVLNNRSATINYLAQGFPGAVAASNGMDVGFGLDNGKGISDKGYRMVSYAVIDLADGTWVDLGFAMAEGKREIVATMLWQTGEDHTVAAAACGQGPKTPVVSITKKSGPSGTVLNVTGANLAANKPVAIYFDTASGTPLATVNATSGGTIDQPVTIPTTFGGRHKIVIVAADSNLRTARSFTVTPSVSTRPLAGQALSTVTMDVSSFAPNETVTVFWDGSTIGAGSTTVNALGAGRFTTRAPWTNGVHTGLIRGSSGLNVSFTFNVTPRIKLTPTSGPGGTVISVRGTGFTPSTSVNVFWGSAVSNRLVCSAVTSADKGAFTCTGRPIAGSTAGNYSLIAISGGLSARATFTLTSLASVAEDTETPTVVPTPTSTPSATATPVPTETPTPEPTESPTVVPSETPIAEPTAEPTIEPTAPPVETPVPEPTTREIVLYPVADTSVSRTNPDAAAGAAANGVLVAGGTDGTIAFISFAVEGIAPGTVVSATLALTGAGTPADGGTVRVIQGYVIDEATVSYNGVPVSDLPVAGVAGTIEPGIETTVDVTGVVSGDGTITFVVRGSRQGPAEIGSRESGTPPRLVIQVLDPTT